MESEGDPVAAAEAWDCELCKDRDHLQRPASAAAPAWWGGAAPTQRRLARALEGRRAHVAIVGLTLLDLTIVVTELSLFSFYPVAEDAPHSVHVAEEVLSWTSVAILSLFTLEQLAKLAVFGFRYFARLWHAFDFVIIVTSLVLEAVLRGPARDTVALLVVFRLWRLVRVIHGVSEVEEAEHAAALERHHAAEAALAARVATLEAALAAAKPGAPGGERQDGAPLARAV